MIKADGKKVVVKGSPMELAIDLGIATHAVIEAHVKNGIPREESVDLVRKSVELAFKTKEEIHAEVQEKLGKFLMRVGSDILDGRKEEQADE